MSICRHTITIWFAQSKIPDRSTFAVSNQPRQSDIGLYKASEINTVCYSTPDNWDWLCYDMLQKSS